MQPSFSAKMLSQTLNAVLSTGLGDFHRDLLAAKNAKLPSNTANARDQLRFYENGQPKLFEEIVVFIGRLEASFQIEKRSVEVEKLLMAVWVDGESPFRQFVESQYGKVTLIFGGILGILECWLREFWVLF